MKRLSKLLAVLTAAGMTAVYTAGIAYADDTQTQTDVCYVSVEKFSIGQGYVFAPEAVTLEEGDTALDLLIKAVGEENVITVSSDYGNYVDGFKDNGGEEVVLADCVAAAVDVQTLTGRTTEGELKSYDYTAQSGFMFFVNNQSASVGVDSYQPTAGDVIRMQFSIYGYGSDIGIDNSSWGGESSLIPETNRDELTKLIALKLNEGLDVTQAMAVIANLDSTQQELDAAYALLEQTVVEEETEDTGDSNVTNEPQQTEDEQDKTPEPEVTEPEETDEPEKSENPEESQEQTEAAEDGGDDKTTEVQDVQTDKDSAEKTPTTGGFISLLVPAAALTAVCLGKKKN